MEVSNETGLHIRTDLLSICKFLSSCETECEQVRKWLLHNHISVVFLVTFPKTSTTKTLFSSLLNDENCEKHPTFPKWKFILCRGAGQWLFQLQSAELGIHLLLPAGTPSLSHCPCKMHRNDALTWANWQLLKCDWSSLCVMCPPRTGTNALLTSAPSSDF